MHPLAVNARLCGILCGIAPIGSYFWGLAKPSQDRILSVPFGAMTSCFADLLARLRFSGTEWLGLKNQYRSVENELLVIQLK